MYFKLVCLGKLAGLLIIRNREKNDFYSVEIISTFIAYSFTIFQYQNNTKKLEEEEILNLR